LLDRRQRSSGGSGWIFLVGVAGELEGFQFGLGLGRRLNWRLRQWNRSVCGLVGGRFLVEAAITLPSRF